METIADKIRALFYGPGWMPGKPRLGYRSEIPDKTGGLEYEVQLPSWKQIYLAVNSLVVALVYLDAITQGEVCISS